VRAPLIIGPDEESRQWVEAIAAAAQAPWLVTSKTRLGDRRVVEAALALGEHRSSRPVLVDDIISTGRTIIAAIEQLCAQQSIASTSSP
jgi:ribose-phosphate pyrophosphokinase